MCGIVGCFGGRPIADALTAYRKQQMRGYEGFGYLALKDGKLVDFMRSSHESQIVDALGITENLQPDAILFHHRFPTSTINVPESAHPLPITKKGWKHRYWMLHNGVVHGNETVAQIESRGYTFKSCVKEIKYYRAGKNVYETVVDSDVNDSEFLGVYVAELLEGERKDIPLSGAIAALVLAEDKKTKRCTVYVMRNTLNPLVMERSKGEKVHSVRISSEGTGAVVPHGVIHRLNLKTLALEEHMTVAIGQSGGGGGSTLAYPYGFNYGLDNDDDSRYYLTEKGYYAPREKTTVPEKSEEAVIASELSRLSLEADKAWAEYQEAVAVLAGDESPQAVEWLKELQADAEKAEEAYQEVFEGLSAAEQERVSAESEELEKMPF